MNFDFSIKIYLIKKYKLSKVGNKNVLIIIYGIFDKFYGFTDHESVGTGVISGVGTGLISGTGTNSDPVFSRVIDHGSVGTRTGEITGVITISGAPVRLGSGVEFSVQVEVTTGMEGEIWDCAIFAMRASS